MTSQFSDDDYIYDPLDAGSDPDFLQQEAFDYIQSQWPDWVPNESNLETWLIAVCARMVAEARDVATDVPRAIFRYYGRSVLGIPPIDATRSSVDATITISSNPAGRTIPVQTTFSIHDADDEPHEFEIYTEVVFPPGVLVMSPVTLRATVEGETENSLGGPGTEAVNSESIAWISTVMLSGITANGTDGESDSEYLDRLSRRLTTYGPKLTNGPDWEINAKDIAAQNGANVRVLGFDGYNPLDGTLNNEGMVGLALVDNLTGADISSALKTIVNTELQSMREVNFSVAMIDPTRTTVDVTLAGKVRQNADVATVTALVEGAIQNFLDSSDWGRTESKEWDQQTAVRHQDISTVVNNVDGFDHWDTLTIGLNGGPQDASDKTLAGIAPLAAPGAITVNLTT